ncbi:MAG: type II toxin-antitoxin system RelE/ParE family toxin [Micrococcales bacterium]|nr:type II toxin-antitoxin system RelE/ParE family toxin [Micrococcales bacterium]
MPGDDRYEVVLAPGARRALSETLPPSAAFAAYEFVAGPLADNPRRVGAPLRAPFAGYYRARRGEYRVRYRIDEEQRRVIVVDIDHRRDAYHA